MILQFQKKILGIKERHSIPSVLGNKCGQLQVDVAVDGRKPVKKILQLPKPRKAFWIFRKTIGKLSKEFMRPNLPASQQQLWTTSIRKTDRRTQRIQKI